MTPDEKFANRLTSYIDFLIEQFLNNYIKRDELLDQIFLVLFTILDLKRFDGNSITEEDFIKKYCIDGELDKPN